MHSERSLALTDCESRTLFCVLCDFDVRSNRKNSKTKSINPLYVIKLSISSDIYIICSDVLCILWLNKFEMKKRPFISYSKLNDRIDRCETTEKREKMKKEEKSLFVVTVRGERRKNLKSFLKNL